MRIFSADDFDQVSDAEQKIVSLSSNDDLPISKLNNNYYDNNQTNSYSQDIKFSQIDFTGNIQLRSNAISNSIFERTQIFYGKTANAYYEHYLVVDIVTPSNQAGHSARRERLRQYLFSFFHSPRSTTFRSGDQKSLSHGALQRARLRALVRELLHRITHEAKGGLRRRGTAGGPSDPDLRLRLQHLHLQRRRGR